MIETECGLTLHAHGLASRRPILILLLTGSLERSWVNAENPGGLAIASDVVRKGRERGEFGADANARV